jgi:ribosomal protein S18 acetylase RimI-like enzyme
MPRIRILDAAEALAALPQLSDLFSATVCDGASMGFMLPFPPEEAAEFWRGVAGAVSRDEVVLMVAEAEGQIVGSVQLGIRMPPNQPHRADLKKLMVHPGARGEGLSRLLMQAAEEAAVARGRDLLVLDTATGEPAEKIYEHFGWMRAGTVPRYALMPDGRYCATTFFYKELSQ